MTAASGSIVDVCCKGLCALMGQQHGECQRKLHLVGCSKSCGRKASDEPTDCCPFDDLTKGQFPELCVLFFKLERRNVNTFFASKCNRTKDETPWTIMVDVWLPPSCVRRSLRGQAHCFVTSHKTLVFSRASQYYHSGDSHGAHKQNYLSCDRWKRTIAHCAALVLPTVNNPAHLKNRVLRLGFVCALLHRSYIESVAALLWRGKIKKRVL